MWSMLREARKLTGTRAGHRRPSISFMKASYTSSFVCTEIGADEPALGAALVKGRAGSSSCFLWEVAAAPLFSRRTRSAVGTKRVISALGLVIWGLALMVAVAFFSMVAALVSSALGRWIRLGGALRTPGFGMGAGGNSPGGAGPKGGTRGGRSIPGRGGGIPVTRKESTELSPHLGISKYLITKMLRMPGTKSKTEQPSTRWSSTGFKKKKRFSTLH